MKIKKVILHIPRRVSYGIWSQYINFRNKNITLNEASYREVPIIINNRNHLTYLTRLVISLKERNYNNLIVLDNDSTYPALVDFYKRNEFNLKILKLRKNFGHLALIKSGLYARFCKNPFVYSDPDLEIESKCPKDFLRFFLEKLNEDKNLMRIGLGLKLDDIPDSYPLKTEVLSWEEQFWQKKYRGDFFVANIDTTFALHRPFVPIGQSPLLTVRGSSPFLARHLPWYESMNSLNSNEELIYYRQNAKKQTHWTAAVNPNQRKF